MVVLLFGAAIAGYTFLWASVTGRFVLPARRVGLLRGVAIVATGVVLIFDMSVIARLGEFLIEPNALFWLIAIGHPAAGAVYAVTLVASGPRAVATRRLAYGMWLVLASIPSWSYFLLVILVGLAGVGLARAAAPEDEPGVGLVGQRRRPVPS